MKRTLLLLPVLLIMGCASQASEEWNLNQKLVWALETLDGAPLPRLAEPRLAEDGTLVIHDFDGHISLLFNPQGELIRRFGARGDSTGQVQFYINAFWAGEKVVIGALPKLHFYDKFGRFLGAEANNLFFRFPLTFLDDDVFLTTRSAISDGPMDTLRIDRIDLTRGEAMPFCRLPGPFGSNLRIGVVVLGLTPQVGLARDAATGTLFVGKSDSPEIRVLDERGRLQGGFRLSLSRYPVSQEEKRAHFRRFGGGGDQLEAILSALPDSLAYYHHLTAQKGWLMVYPMSSLTENPSELQLQFYTPQGRLIYWSVIRFGEGWRISGGVDNVQIKGNRMVAVLVNSSGMRRLAMFEIEIPKKIEESFA